MQLTSIEIKNFKGIDEKGVKIKISPITMLFGPNNAGKSTIIQALHLANEVFCSTSPNLETRGKLGSFKDYVHKHDLSRVVCIRLDWDNVVMLAPSFIEHLQLLEYPAEIERIVSNVKSMGIEISISMDYAINGPIVSNYTLYFNGYKLTSLCLKPDVSGEKAHISNEFWVHPANAYFA